MATIEGVPIKSLKKFDMTEMLQNKEDMTIYLNMVLQDGDREELLRALSHCARAKGMTEMAKASGLRRESLYNALRPGATPRFDTIQKVIKALGCRLAVV